METVYKREKKYNDEAGGRLSGDMDETRENGDKVIEKKREKRSHTNDMSGSGWERGKRPWRAQDTG